jgi:phage terminase large subunit-like protein
MPAALRIFDPKDPQTQALLQAIAHREKYAKIQTLFSDKGKTRRFLYKKHLIHFKAGKKYRQRLFMCGNRVGKTTAAGVELVYHLTGEYPQWWEGRRYRLPQDWWVCGEYSHTIRSSLQPLLIGPVGDFGTGLIPRHLLDIDSMTAAKKMDTPITDFKVRHSSGGYSTVGFRSYDQGRRAFQSTERCIWLDEEPPKDVFEECLMRTMTRASGDGESMLLLTFTPLNGWSETIKSFIGEEINYTEGQKGLGKWMTMADWDDVPHLTEKDKEEMREHWRKTAPHLLDARSKGIPVLGEGAVYPIEASRVFIDPISIPETFKRVFALDFGFDPDPTAILWGAIDPETDCLYIYAEHYLKMAEPMIHAAVINQHTRLAKYTIPGVCDPSGGGSSTADGKFTKDIYRKEYGIIMVSAINSVEPGITTVLDYLTRDRLKIFNTCVNTKREFHMYQRDKRGNPSGADHLMDCLRYLVMSGINIAKSYHQVQQAKLIAESSEGRNPFGPSYWSQYDM